MVMVSMDKQLVFQHQLTQKKTVPAVRNSKNSLESSSLIWMSCGSMCIDVSPKGTFNIRQLCTRLSLCIKSMCASLFKLNESTYLAPPLNQLNTYQHCPRPRSQDNVPYNNTQLREMAHGIRGKIRKINQKHANTPDSTPTKFLDLIIKIVERVKSRVQHSFLEIAYLNIFEIIL